MRLDEVAARWSLDGQAHDRLAALLELVRDDPHAATSVRDPEAAVFVHLADSLSALPFLDALGSPAGTPPGIADIGSGAGFPGLPIAVARPQFAVDLIESVGRKCKFMEAAASRLGLAHVRVLNTRAEELARGEGRARYAAVLARAVAALPVLVEYAAPLLAPGGRLIAWKGERAAGEEGAGADAAARVGLQPAGVAAVHPYAGSRSHNLYLYEKVSPTPPGFPRRAGAARKRPLA